jgi:hypothetical protein
LLHEGQLLKLNGGSEVGLLNSLLPWDSLDLVMVPVTEKYTIAPLYVDPFGSHPPVPFPVTEEVSFDSVEGVLEPKNFSLWEGHASPEALKALSKITYGLVHRFSSSPYFQGETEESSRELVHRLFVCLRVVKPTRTPFFYVQYQMIDGKKDVFTFVAPEDSLSLNLPESEVLNHLNTEDLRTLKRLAPPFLKAQKEGPAYLRRAIRYYESGYVSVREADLQLTVWMMGIEALFSYDDEPCDVKTIKARIADVVGLTTDIYTEFDQRDLYAAKPVRVGDVLDQMFELRNRFVHGAWVPKAWFDQNVRMAISGGSLTMADVVREAASFVLRSGIRHRLLNNNS